MHLHLSVCRGEIQSRRGAERVGRDRVGDKFAVHYCTPHQSTRPATAQSAIRPTGHQIGAQARRKNKVNGGGESHPRGARQHSGGGERVGKMQRGLGRRDAVRYPYTQVEARSESISPKPLCSRRWWSRGARFWQRRRCRQGGPHASETRRNLRGREAAQWGTAVSAQNPGGLARRRRVYGRPIWFGPNTSFLFYFSFSFSVFLDRKSVV